MKARTDRVIRAAGTVILRGRGRNRQVLLVHRGRRQDWSLPKGKSEFGEYSCVAAVRETLEETGLAVTLGPRLPALSYFALGQPKVVDYWIGRLTDDAVASGDVDLSERWAANEEVDEMRWVSLARVARLLTYAHDLKVVQAASGHAGLTCPFIILRHAKAEKRASFAARHRGQPVSDQERPLTAEGEAMTPMVAQAMAAYGVNAFHSSPARRCFDTISPHSAAPHQIVREPALSEEDFLRDAQRTATRTSELALVSQSLVVCSHRPVIPTMVDSVARLTRTHAADTSLKPGEFVVFHRSLKRSGQVDATREFLVEHSQHSEFQGREN